MNYITVHNNQYFNGDILFYMDKCDYQDYSAIKYHCHEFIEIAYVCNGKGKHIINGYEYPVSKGNLYIINVDIPHSFYPIDIENSGQLTVMNCIFMPQFIENINIELPILKEIINIFLYKSFYTEEIDYDSDGYFACEAGDDIGRIFNKMYMEYKLKKQGYKEILKILLCELLIEIYRDFKKKSSFLDKCETAKYEFIEEAINYLEKNYSKKLNVQDICKQVYMSKSYFSSLFKEITGTSVIDYLQKVRIEKACTLLLKYPVESVMEIAYRVGYRDYKFFNKIFKRITGLTAQEYRKKFI
jgi:AraC family transcriptional regulator, L-rhamnose operon transcriptional activator RhaR